MFFFAQVLISCRCSGEGRVLIEPAPEKYSDYATGAIPPATQPLAEDPVLKPVFENKDVILRAGGISSLEAELERRFECQYPHGSWHSENFTLFRHEPGSIRLCWACDNLLRDQYTETLAGIARENLVSWLITVIRSQLGFNEDHQLTIPELCWWLVINNLAHVIPESLARKALRLPEIQHKPGDEGERYCAGASGERSGAEKDSRSSRRS